MHNHFLTVVSLHHDIASSHTSTETTAFVSTQNIDLMSHPPCSTDLALNDFFLFPYIRNKQRGQRFSTPELAIDTLRTHSLDIPESEWQKCFENWKIYKYFNREYFEKQWSDLRWLIFIFGLLVLKYKRQPSYTDITNLINPKVRLWTVAITYLRSFWAKNTKTHSNVSILCKKIFTKHELYCSNQRILIELNKTNSNTPNIINTNL